MRIDIVGNLLELRHDVAEGPAKVKHRGERAALDAVESVMYHPHAWAAAVKAAGIAGVVAPKKHLPPPLSGWTESRFVPAVPKESFRSWWARTDGGVR